MVNSAILLSNSIGNELYHLQAP